MQNLKEYTFNSETVGIVQDVLTYIEKHNKEYQLTWRLEYSANLSEIVKLLKSKTDREISLVPKDDCFQMFLTEHEEVKKPVCNHCGREIDFGQEDFENTIMLMGYGSKYDMEAVDITWCYDCLDKIIDECKVSPIKGDKHE